MPTVYSNTVIQLLWVGGVAKW